MPQGEAWHRQLLDGMEVANEVRTAVISAALYDTLSEYLARLKPQTDKLYLREFESQ